MTHSKICWGDVMDDSTTPYRYRPGPGTTDNPSITVGGWAYEDEEQTRFAFICSSEGFGLPSFDDFIDSLPDGVAQQELLDWRQQAFNAHKTGNTPALRGWLQAAWTNWRARLTVDHVQPTVAMGLSHSKVQAEKGKAGAAARWGIGPDGNLRMDDIIKWLALSAEHAEEKAWELWPHFYAELDAQHLNPAEVEDTNDWKKSWITYDGQGKRDSITGKTFANKVAIHRSGKKSR